MTRSIEELPTPAVLVDLDVLEKNILRQASRAREARVRLRPHAKTHKCPEIARMQISAGAAGISLAKTSEAEVFADAGFDDIFVAYPVVGLGKAERLLALARRIRLAVGCDSAQAASELSRVFEADGRKLDVLLKVDVGYHRVGVNPADALEVARAIGKLRGLTLRGIFTHAGHVYSAGTPEEVSRIATLEGRTLVETALALRDSGVAVEEVSVGSTPSARDAMRVPGVTECRPGNYVFHDGTQVALGTCAPEDCAMTVLATVVSVPAPDRAVVDAGSKTLSQDSLKPRPDGNGLILGTRTRLVSLTEEHGVARVAEGDSFRVGQRVRILPNHACVVSNLHDRLFGVRSGRVATVLPVAARGRIE
ncbi:MAG TPA: alanine racemase [Thermoanaerobaculia bacterium]|nr:alanine racemase [Thermoanaerobaculia bacterium]